jgi:lipoprotein-anchoring transpeptidase ErfK/SrfK
VPDQKLKLVKAGQPVASFPISTSKFGLGDTFHSYKTPLGQMKVVSKTGDKLPEGAVLKGGQFTGEVLAVNAAGRDPIVTRIIRLKGLEKQNRNALTRGIFIHGTPEEKRIGKPVSWGCIRMRSKDVVKLYEMVDVGTSVVIINEKVKRYLKKDTHREPAFADNWFF